LPSHSQGPPVLRQAGGQLPGQAGLALSARPVQQPCREPRPLGRALLGGGLRASVPAIRAGPGYRAARCRLGQQRPAGRPAPRCRTPELCRAARSSSPRVRRVVVAVQQPVGLFGDHRRPRLPATNPAPPVLPPPVPSGALPAHRSARTGCPGTWSRSGLRHRPAASTASTGRAGCRRARRTVGSVAAASSEAGPCRPLPPKHGITSPMTDRLGVMPL